MKDHLNREIKQVIEEYPEIGDILNQYGVGCTDCTVGTCFLKDVVDIHFLPPEEEEPMMKAIEEIVTSGRTAAGSAPGPTTTTGKNNPDPHYSRAVQLLVNEHNLIKRLLALIPVIIEDISESGLEQQLILDCTDFIRNYADKFHHAKEEDIMFKYVDESAEIIQVMYTDHHTGRNHVRAIHKALAENNADTVISHLLQYRDLLTEHIKKEDEVLYPWIERQMTDTQVEEMLDNFVAEEVRLGTETTEKYESLIQKLESKLYQGEEVHS